MDTDRPLWWYHYRLQSVVKCIRFKCEMNEWRKLCWTNGNWDRFECANVALFKTPNVIRPGGKPTQSSFVRTAKLYMALNDLKTLKMLKMLKTHRAASTKTKNKSARTRCTSAMHPLLLLRPFRMNRSMIPDDVLVIQVESIVVHIYIADLCGGTMMPRWMCVGSLLHFSFFFTSFFVFVAGVRA